jgi:methyl-accepting chemotaxis protein
LHRIEGMSIELADVAGDLEGMHVFVQSQETLFGHLVTLAREVLDAVERIDGAGQSTSTVTREAAESMRQSAQALERAIDNIAGLTRSVGAIGDRLGAVERSLEGVGASSLTIRTVAQQTNLLALNATIEAAHAGEAGRGFAVVAREVKTLAGQSQEAAQAIQKTTEDLAHGLEDLIETSDHIVVTAREANDGIGVINQAVSGFQSSIGTVDDHVNDIAGATATTRTRCADILREITSAAEGVATTSKNLQRADKRLGSMVTLGEDLIATILDSGLLTPDRPYIDAVRRGAAQLAAALERAIDQGRITMDALFSEVYSPLPGTNPEQCLAPFTELTDEIFPPVQEALLETGDKVVFCAAVDRNAYLPTHNRKFSQPQGSDPVWNNANCRNRRIFNDRTGLAAGRNTRPFLVQTYRRDMGGGTFIMMKDASAPILVRGRHWGGLRMGYRL